MKIKFIPRGEDMSGYFSLKSLLLTKGFTSPCGNYATIPDGYTLVTNGETWNLEKEEASQ